MPIVVEAWVGVEALLRVHRGRGPWLRRRAFADRFGVELGLVDEGRRRQLRLGVERSSPGSQDLAEEGRFGRWVADLRSPDCSPAWKLTAGEWANLCLLGFALRSRQLSRVADVLQ